MGKVYVTGDPQKPVPTGGALFPADAFYDFIVEEADVRQKKDADTNYLKLKSRCFHADNGKKVNGVAFDMVSLKPGNANRAAVFLRACQVPYEMVTIPGTTEPGIVFDTDDLIGRAYRARCYHTQRGDDPLQKQERWTDYEPSKMAPTAAAHQQAPAPAMYPQAGMQAPPQQAGGYVPPAPGAYPGYQPQTPPQQPYPTPPQAVPPQQPPAQWPPQPTPQPTPAAPYQPQVTPATPPQQPPTQAPSPYPTPGAPGGPFPPFPGTGQG